MNTDFTKRHKLGHQQYNDSSRKLIGKGYPGNRKCTGEEEAVL